MSLVCHTVRMVRIATASSDKTITLWDVQTGKELKTLSGHKGRVLSVSFSPDGALIATGGAYDGTIKLWTRVPARNSSRLADFYDMYVA